MGKDEFIDILRSDLSNSEICDRCIFSNYAWLFKSYFDDDHLEQYHFFKSFFGDYFNVAPRNVCLAGSGKLGFSLKPGAALRNFDLEGSDLDIVIVSHELFESFWSILLKAQYSWSLKLWPGHKHNVFRKFVSFKPFAEDGIQEINEWNIKMGEMQSQFFVKFGISNTLNYRIYRDWEAANAYHCNGIEALRKDHAT